MILTQDEIMPRFRELVKQSNKIDLAVAWAWSCDALDILLDFASSRGRELRAIVGLSGNGSHPNALRDLSKSAALRIMPNHPMFHCKCYLFETEKGLVVWIGSANLTQAGFQKNVELIHEFRDQSGKSKNWFNEIWHKLDADPTDTIDNYSENWEPPSFSTSRSQPDSIPPAPPKIDTLTDWRSFVQAILEADAFWEQRFDCTVTGEFASWTNTISLGRSIAHRENWDNLSKEDASILLGLSHRYGLLGSMIGAGHAKNVFLEETTENLRIREIIRSALQPVIDASFDDFPMVASEFISKVNELDRFGSAIATRFMALAKPEYAISVNKASQNLLSEATGLPKTSLSNPEKGTRARSYTDLLNWLRAHEWYENPTPQNQFEELLSQYRAALVDPLVYGRDD